MGFLSWLIVGGVAGWLASIVMKTNAKQGLIMDIIVGIVGSFIGGFALSLLGIGSAGMSFSIESLGTAFIGAVILLAILRFVRK